MLRRNASPELASAINKIDSLFRRIPIEHVRYSARKRTFYVCFANEKSAKYIGAAPRLIDALEAAFGSFVEAHERQE